MSLVLDPETHIYSDGTDRKWTSVSKVISTVMAKSWEGVDPAVIANAAERGQRVENYATEILRDGGCSVGADERQDVQDRVGNFYDWYEAVKPDFISAQDILSDEVNRIAGTRDFKLLIDGLVVAVDLKCTASPEPAWALQIGGYDSMDPTEKCAVLHINPKYAKGWIWREYEPVTVRDQWRSALSWYRTLEQLKAKA